MRGDWKSSPSLTCAPVEPTAVKCWTGEKIPRCYGVDYGEVGEEDCGGEGEIC